MVNGGKYSSPNGASWSKIKLYILVIWLFDFDGVDHV